MIRIKSTQIPLGEDPEVMEFMTEGKHYIKNGAHYIVYEESELSGMKGCMTTLKLEENKIKMKRFGDANSELMFEKGKRHVSDYVTPYGNFKLTIRTSQLEWGIDDSSKGKIHIKYDLSMQSVLESANEMEIEIL
jgi:uncharacterized beta-barrel protein YwiB (DUF1934 family)